MQTVATFDGEVVLAIRLFSLVGVSAFGSFISFSLKIWL